MLRVRNIGDLLLLFCFHNSLYEAFAHSIKSQETYAVENGAYVNHVIDWKCESNLDCSAVSSSCVSGTCQCHDGYIYNSNMTACLKVATSYGDNCEESIQCSRYLFSGGICMNTTCVCAQGYYYLHGRCNAYSGLFEKCHKDVDCYLNGDFEATSCVNGECKCSPGYYQREHRTCRPKAKGIGEKCIIDNDCKHLNSTAHCNFENLCRNQGEDDDVLKHFYNKDVPEENNTSGTGSRFGSKCTVDEDCKELGHGGCELSGTCVCKRAYFFIQDLGKCVPELGEPCEPADNVTIAYSECRNGTWNCEVDRAVFENNRKCVKATKRYTNYCSSDLQCFVFGPDAVCQNEKCVCNGKSRFNETELFCWAKRGISELCWDDIDCYANELDPSMKLSCTNNLCTCPSGTHPNTNLTSCLSTSADIGKQCEVHNDCVKKHTQCVNAICTCEENYYESNNECIAGVNSTCTEHSDCSPQNSECVSGNCTCKKGYVALSTASCIPVVSIDQPCEENIQCSSKLPNSVCSRGNNSTTNLTCNCMEGYHYKFNKCFKRKVLGMSCENLGECYLDSGDQVVCKNGRCACDWGYTRVNDTACKSVQRYDANGSTIRTGALGLLSIGLLLIKFLI